MQDKTCGVEECLHASCHAVRTHIDDLEQEIAYAQVQIDEKAAYIKRCQAELNDLLGLPQDWKALPNSLFQRSREAAAHARAYAEQHGNPVDNMQSLFEDIPEHIWRDILENPYG